MRHLYRAVASGLVCLAMPYSLFAQSAAERYARGIVRLAIGDYDGAITDLDQALAINPGYTAAYFSRGFAWGKKGDCDKAIADFSEVIRLDPKHAEARYDRGRMWEKKLEYDNAFADYSEALRLNPNSFMVRNNLAWLQATCPIEKYRDGKKALENATRARQLYGVDHWKIVTTLAAAYAENGEFDKARELQEKAIQLVGKDPSATETNHKEIKSRLELYRASKPFREPARSK